MQPVDFAALVLLNAQLTELASGASADGSRGLAEELVDLALKRGGRGGVTAFGLNSGRIPANGVVQCHGNPSGPSETVASWPPLLCVGYAPALELVESEPVAELIA